MASSSAGRSGQAESSSGRQPSPPPQLISPADRADSDAEDAGDDSDESALILSAEDNDDQAESSTSRKRKKDGVLPASNEPASTSKARPTSAASSRKRKRVSRACDQCWVRKDKCDGAAPACSICARLSRDCTYTRPEKKRGPQQGVRGRLEAQCAALECVLGWILTCAEREARGEGSSSSNGGGGATRQNGGHPYGRSRASVTSQFSDEPKTEVPPGSLVRLLLQPASIATSAAWSPNLGLPPPDMSLSALAQHWRKSVLATYLTSPLAPSSPGLAIGLEGAAAVADGLDMGLAARQASGEAGLFGAPEEIDANVASFPQTGPDAFHQEWAVAAAAVASSEATGTSKSKTSMRPPGKTRRTLGPAPTPRQVVANPAAAFPPVSRGPPPRRPQRDELSDTSPDQNGAGRETMGISDVWASPTDLSVSLPTLSSFDRNHEQQQPTSHLGSRRQQHSESPVQQLPSPATDWVTSLHAEHQGLQQNSGGRVAPDVTSSSSTTLPATHSQQQLQDSWSAMFSSGTSVGASNGRAAGAVAILASSPSFMSPFDPATSSGPSNPMAHRESFSFTDPDAQALLYALGLSVGGVGDHGSTTDGVSPGMSQNTPSAGHVSRQSQTFLPVSNAFPTGTSGRSQDASPASMGGGGGGSLGHETAKRGQSQPSVDHLDAYISPWEALNIPVSTASDVAPPPPQAESYASKYLQSSVGSMQPFDDQAGAVASSDPAGRRITGPASAADSARANRLGSCPESSPSSATTSISAAAA
ncbi:hypothetical protein OC846_000848 [Tilletia horrida]|uniref:Zn(2)-C6 fungal-type domain-containing protein n=1 Tax=Tilletia horrida TaxID=155126 RepID=A0AAN6GX05_9BASI|nr:hypothetical protein OC846_000848 [Tilletia horrida]